MISDRHRISTNPTPPPAACSVYELNFKLNQFKIETENGIVISIKCKWGVLVCIMSVRMKTFIK